MVKNNGMTNSARFFNSRSEKFEVENCFKYNSTSIENALKNMEYIVDHSEDFTESEIQFEAQLLADEFYTIVKTAIDWNKTKLKSE